MDSVKWNKVETKEDLPKEYGCYYFALHNHKTTVVCVWREERNTDATAQVVAYWAEINNFPNHPDIKIKMPEPSSPRFVREGCSVFCNICNSTMPRIGLFGIYGKRSCDNNCCINNIKHK